MITPRIEINLDKIAHNTRLLKSLYSSKGNSIMCSTKVVCGDTKIAKVLLEINKNILTSKSYCFRMKNLSCHMF